jgi:branched-chain amino acid transport system permease protein
VDYWWNILDLVLIFSMFAVSLNLLLGYAGQVSVAHAAFGAIGGYVAAYLAQHAGTGFLAGVAIGTVAAGVVGLLVSLPALRLSAEYLILLTIAVSSIVLAIVGAVPALGGSQGLIAPKPAELLGKSLLFPGDWIVPLLVAAAFTYAVCRRMGESAWGRVLRGIRDDDVAMRALGHDVFAYKAAVFGITAAFAGFAGALLFYYDQLASPDVYGFNVSLQIFAMVIFGGLGNFAGSVLGAAALILVQPLLEKVVHVDASKSFLVQLVIYGLGLVVLMRVRPQGLLPEGASLLPRRRPAPATAIVREEKASPAAAPADAEILLDVQGLEKRFGGIAACRDLDLSLRRGEITALVGPNGAGKTTVFNLLAGTLRADGGSIRLRGEELRGRTPDEIARQGMARTFQDVRLFARLTALENVMLGVRDVSREWWRWPAGTRGGQNLAHLFLLPGYVRRVERDTRARALECLALVGLVDSADVPAASLSFGQQKLVSLARLLATDADVLLLDEPASGIDARWVDSILELIAHVRGQGKTVCVVEHSLHVVEQLADTVFFMELGQITARGSIGELTSDARLAEVYFGTV